MILDALSSSSPDLQNGLDIGRQAELYAHEKSFQTSLETFQTALGILVPVLSNEPSENRKNLLHQQIMTWMNEAENIKLLISEPSGQFESNPSASTSNSRNCALQ